MMTPSFYKQCTLLFLFTLCAIIALPVAELWAQPAPTCTSQMQSYTGGNNAIITAVMDTISSLLSNTSEQLYETVIGDSEYLAARNAVILLVVTIYGIMILFDLANFRPGEIMMMLFKIALIMALTGPSGWQFFNDFVYQFFMGTMMEMIGIFTGTSVGNLGGQAGNAVDLAAPLAMLNWPMAKTVSTQFFITVIGSFFTGPYGFMIAIFLIWGGFNLLMSLFSALFTYIKSVVGLWFLFALSPIFFLFLLFRRTANLFEGWLNMTLSFTIQPILLFAFLSFFIAIVTASLDQITSTVDWCWVPLEGSSEGSFLELHWWQPIMLNGDVVTGGVWGLFGYMNNRNIIFPIDLMDVMFFLLSSYIAWQYSRFVTQIATELSSSGLRISASAEAARNYFQARGATPEQIGTRMISTTGRWFR